jgi:hypothetical protein
MPAPLIDESRFDEIRSAIDTTLGEANLPNEIIAKDIYLGRALRWVASKTTNTGPEAKNAAIYYIAYLICPSMPQLESDRKATGDGYQVKVENLQDKLDRLLTTAQGYISEIDDVTPVLATQVPEYFTLARGRRGR